MGQRRMEHRRIQLDAIWKLRIYRLCLTGGYSATSGATTFCTHKQQHRRHRARRNLVHNATLEEGERGRSSCDGKQRGWQYRRSTRTTAMRPTRVQRQGIDVSSEFILFVPINESG